MSTDTGDRTAAIEALTATLTAGLDEDEAAANAWEDAPWLYAGTEATNWSRKTRATDGTRTVHIARHDPARVLRDVKATRDLLAAILAERHEWIAGDEFYSCSQAVDYAGLNHESSEPGSACSDPDRAGQPCDCGRDARVERLLRILARVYEEGTGAS